MTHLIRSVSLAAVLAAILLQVLASLAAGATRYVNLNNSTPVSPYTNWLSAATNIQDAVDAAGAGDEVVVADGHYAAGGRALYGLMTNRVVIDKAVAVRSVNGPLVTTIEGAAAPGFVNGDGAVRCVYVGTNAVLSGFTLTNGHTRVAGHDTIEQSGGGAWCEISGVVSNCTFTGNSADNAGGGAYRGTLNNCTLGGNSAQNYGGGANGATLNNCTLSSNLVSFFVGGGGSACTLSNCILIGNSAGFGGGGGADCSLNNCTLTGNSASDSGGGAENSTLNNCTLSGNWASSGGGAFQSTLNNCTLASNSASDSGGGVIYGTLNNCTLSGNSASFYGGGANFSVLNNCIAYYNFAPNGPNHYGSTFNYSCATPLPPGPGNIAVEPLLASTSHLSAESPCIGQGSSADTHGLDIDGERWLDPPCMGADQFVAGQATGGLAMAFTAAYTNVSAGFAVAFVAQTSGHLASSVWDFGDGVVVSNRPYASHAWAVPGLYEVRLTGYNADWPDGVSATVRVQVGVREVYYVNATNAAPLYPYTNRADAAASIQEAIDAGVQIGRLVLVADGAYGTGGRVVYGLMTNRVVVSEGAEVRSVNGPLVTQIEGASVDGTTNGDGAIRCVYVSTNAVLIGFTLTNGHTRAEGDYAKEQSGGGVWCEPSGAVSNCTLTGNSAQRRGGGAYGGTLNRCTLSSNLAGTSYSGAGGGAYNVALNNCTLAGNSAGNGGGAYGGTLNNCTLSDNSAGNGGGGVSGATLNNCILSGNWASYEAGGASFGTLNNCTLSGNSAGYDGG
ncbi:MAG TPA: PKD domain-containing protein, partial [Verrucomicrobiae bacterium]